MQYNNKKDYLIFKTDMDCFGKFTMSDDICKNLCIYSLQCAQSVQENDLNSQILDEILFAVSENFMSIY